MRTRFTVVIAMLVVVVGAAVYSLLGPHSANEVRQHESGSAAGDSLEPSVAEYAAESPGGNALLVESSSEHLAPVPHVSEGGGQPEGVASERPLAIAIENEEHVRSFSRGLIREQSYIRINERRVAAGLPPVEVPPRPPQLGRFYSLLEEHGFTREELYPPYRELMPRLLTYLEPGFPTTPKTLEVKALCDASNWEGVQQLIERRLDENPEDIPALLLRFRLNTIQVMVDEMFMDAELIVPAIAKIEPEEFDKRAILYDVMDDLETYMYAGDSWMELQRENVERTMQTGRSLIMADTLVILHFLEIEDLW